MKREWSKRAGAVGVAGIGGALALVLIGAGARSLGDRLGLRNTVYSLLAAVLLLAVVVEAVHHRLMHDHAGLGEVAPARPAGWMLSDPAWNLEPTTGGPSPDDPLLEELRLAARLGAELMGELPASRSGGRVTPTA